MQILDNLISDNKNSYGGGIGLFASGPALIRGNTITRNQAVEGGGIITINESPVLIIQNLITDNGYTGIHYLWQPNCIVNNTIVNNDSGGGDLASGIVAASGMANPTTTVVNNIIVARVGQTAIRCGIDVLGGPPPILRHNNVYSPQGSAYGGGCTDQTGIDGNISADPLFVNPAAGDYHLQPGSLVIDKGDNAAPNLPATDLDGKPRIQDGNGDGIAIVDMGAYEFPAPYNLCIQDDSSGNLLQLNTTTGAYQFTNCGGLTITSLGTLTSRGGVISFQHYASDRRVMAKIDTSTGKATASLQLLSTGMTFSITDRNITNNTCSCSR